MVYSFGRNVGRNTVKSFAPPVAITSMSKPALLISSIDNHQMHNLAKFMTNQQLSEQSLSDKVTTGLMSLLSQSLPLVNLTSQICSIDPTSLIV